MVSLRTANFLLTHPLSRKNKPKAFQRFLSWQIKSRLTGKPATYSFVNESRLLVHPGMTGATGNVYAGLHEFYDMGFVLHALRKDDVFVDVGANIGSYTVIAGAAVGAECVSIEPVPSTFSHLLENIKLNRLEQKVDCLNIGVGKENGTLRFSADEDTKNHVVAASEVCESFTDVVVKPLDDILGERSPTIIKIDVEGWETNAIAGARDLLSTQKPLALLMEFGLGERYGFDDEKLYQEILDLGFQRMSYSPFERVLTASTSSSLTVGNFLFLKDVDYFQQRVQAAPTFRVLDVNL